MLKRRIARTNGTKVISYCLKRAIIRVIPKIKIPGIAAISFPT